MRTGWFERVTSLLAALILLLGTLVLLLAIVWGLSDDRAMRSDARPAPEVIRGTVQTVGLDRDFLVPGGEEVVALNEPDMPETLLALGVAVSGLAESAPDPLADSVGENVQDRIGEPRLAGPNGDIDIVARFRRWQLEFAARDVRSYARQLDHYGIELAAIGGPIQGVDYARNLSTQPMLRRGESEAEKRLYFMWSRPNPLVQFDRHLLRIAGAALESREILKFVPPALEKQLAKIELEYAMGRGFGGVNSIAKTVFTSQAEGDGYQFTVTEQRYRKQQGSPKQQRSSEQSGESVVLDPFSP